MKEVQCRNLSVDTGGIKDLFKFPQGCIFDRCKTGLVFFSQTPAAAANKLNSDGNVEK